jgi:hypothetical protein
MRIWALLSFTACGMGLLLSGCGGGSVPPANAKPDANALAGNWLLVGPMPSNQVNPTGGFRLAMTFDVTGNNIVAVGFGNNSCNNVVSGFEFGTVLAGSVAADGSFTLATPANDLFETISIKGMVPQASGGPWPGSYAVSLTSGLSPSCDANLAGTFTATSFPLISGVYVGTGSMQTIAIGPSTTTPVTFQLNLQQGGMLTNPVNGATSPLTSNAVLTGSIRVQGSPCFNSGATATTPASSVEGSMVNAVFLMDDGSTLDILGSLTDISEGHIVTGVVLISGGKCGISSYFFQLPGLDRQS